MYSLDLSNVTIGITGNKLNLNVEDPQCKQIIKLLKKFDNFDNIIVDNHYDFVSSVLYNLNKYTTLWGFNWDIRDEGHHMLFFTHVPTTIVIPFDLIPHLMTLIKTLGVSSKDLNVMCNLENSSENMIQLSCYGTFSDGYFVRCTNCGNCWDGNAQCMCY
jgi:hypothetical protein